MSEWIWIAREKCGCVIAASVDDQNQDDLKHDIGDWIMQGLSVTHESGRVALGLCPIHLKEKYDTSKPKPPRKPRKDKGIPKKKKPDVGENKASEQASTLTTQPLSISQAGQTETLPPETVRQMDEAIAQAKGKKS